MIQIIKSSFFIFLLNIACFTGMSSTKPSFYLNNDEAKMPVVVRGFLQSNALIIFLHGGPGGTAMKKIGTRAFNTLEEKYGLVYWDQRGAEGAKGGTQKKYMNLSQFVEDLDLLITQLNQRYPSSKIFLMGHCWGGALGTAYLVDPIRQHRIAGWIEVGGSHNNPKGDSLSSEWVKQYARNMIASGKNTRYWKKALRWYRDHDNFSSSALSHYGFVRNAHGYQYAQGDSLGQFPGYTLGDLPRKPLTFLGYYLNYYTTLNRFEISKIDLTPELYKIQIPTLLLWGELDGLVPLAIGQETYQKLGTPEALKQLTVFPNAAHTLYYEQPTRFCDAVITFIESDPDKQNQAVLAKSVRF